jgi:hypothetical protein
MIAAMTENANVIVKVAQGVPLLVIKNRTMVMIYIHIFRKVIYEESTRVRN